MSKSPATQNNRLIFIALGGMALLAGARTAVASERFTFPDAEFMQEDRGLVAAQSFVNSELPPGLEMNLAIARVEQAVAHCKPTAAMPTTVVCEYLIQARPPGGDLGENIWTVRLIPGPDGRLQSATVERSRVGLPGDIAG